MDLSPNPNSTAPTATITVTDNDPVPHSVGVVNMLEQASRRIGTVSEALERLESALGPVLREAVAAYRDEEVPVGASPAAAQAAGLVDELVSLSARVEGLIERVDL